jgi:hypothetical protein
MQATCIFLAHVFAKRANPHPHESPSPLKAFTEDPVLEW